MRSDGNSRSIASLSGLDRLRRRAPAGTLVAATRTRGSRSRSSRPPAELRRRSRRDASSNQAGKDVASGEFRGHRVRLDAPTAVNRRSFASKSRTSSALVQSYRNSTPPASRELQQNISGGAPNRRVDALRCTRVRSVRSALSRSTPLHNDFDVLARHDQRTGPGDVVAIQELDQVLFQGRSLVRSQRRECLVNRAVPRAEYVD